VSARIIESRGKHEHRETQCLNVNIQQLRLRSLSLHVPGFQWDLVSCPEIASNLRRPISDPALTIGVMRMQRESVYREIQMRPGC